MLDTTSQTSIAARASPYLRDGRATSNQGHPESLSLAGTQQSDYHGSLRSGRSYGEAGGYRGGHSTTPSQRKVSSAGQTTRASEGQALMESRKGGNPGRHALLPRYSPLEKTPHKAANGEPPISCRNRHCPKCQANARHRWIAARRQELLPTRYVHVVFTLPHELASLALQNKKILYHLLLQTSAETLLEVARNP